MTSRTAAAGNSSTSITILVVGASGDLAQTKTYPALFQLWWLLRHSNRTARPFRVAGFARTALSDRQLRERLRPHLRRQFPLVAAETVDEFLQLCCYQQGSSYADWRALQRLLLQQPSVIATTAGEQQQQQQQQSGDRNSIRHTTIPNGGNNNPLLLAYLAVPPHVFAVAARALAQALHHPSVNHDVNVRLVLEKPFGRDADSCRELLQSLQQNWKESSLWRIDHYLGKVAVQNLPRIRRQLLAAWNSASYQLRAVHVIWKETSGTEGRGGYFDTVGIVRDVLQNHSLQILALLGMDLALIENNNGDDNQDRVRDAKVQFLKRVATVDPSDAECCLLGQYRGYADDATIANKATTTETYACVRLTVNDNDSDNNHHPWKGVPVVLEAGKALDERLCEARLYLQSRRPTTNGKDSADSESANTAAASTAVLRIRVQPNPAVLWTMTTTNTSSTNATNPPASSSRVRHHQQHRSKSTQRGEIRYRETLLPYTRLLLAALQGRHEPHCFVRSDELLEQWRIFTPLLHRLEQQQPSALPSSTTIHAYEPGTTGPSPRRDFLRAAGVPVEEDNHDGSVGVDAAAPTFLRSSL